MEEQLDKVVAKNKKAWISLIVIASIVVIGIAVYASKKQGDAISNPLKNSVLATSQNEIEKLKSSVDKNITFTMVASNPDAYKGKIIQWGAKVFTQPEKDNDGVYLQAYEGGEDNNFAISYAKPDFQVNEDDFVIITGKVTGKFKGENAFGAKLEIPTVEAGYIEVAKRNDVVAPTELEVPIGKTNTQYDFLVTLEKIELAKNETRFFIKLKNEGKSKVNFYSFDDKLTQGAKQYEKESSYGTGQELPSEILPGVEAEGVIIFPAIDRTQKQLTIHLNEPSNGNYSLDWKTIKFDITLP